MNLVPIARIVLTKTATAGCGTIVKQIIKNNVTTTTPRQAATVAVGAFAIGGLITETAVTHLGDHFDQTVATIKNLKFNKSTVTELEEN